MSQDSDYAEKLIARYHVPDSIGTDTQTPSTRWPLSDYRDESVLLASVAELKHQRNDLIADVHRAEEAAGRTYKAEASAAKYRRYFLWCSGLVMASVAVGIGVFLWNL